MPHMDETSADQTQIKSKFKRKRKRKTNQPDYIGKERARLWLSIDQPRANPYTHKERERERERERWGGRCNNSHPSDIKA